mgnify:CR=1 FL=1
MNELRHSLPRRGRRFKSCDGRRISAARNEVDKLFVGTDHHVQFYHSVFPASLEIESTKSVNSSKSTKSDESGVYFSHSCYCSYSSHYFLIDLINAMTSATCCGERSFSSPTGISDTPADRSSSI